MGVLLNTLLATMPQAKAGKLRLLAVMESRRLTRRTCARLENAGMAPIGNRMAQFAALMKHGFEVYGRAVQLAGAQRE